MLGIHTASSFNFFLELCSLSWRDAEVEVPEFQARSCGFHQDSSNALLVLLTAQSSSPALGYVHHVEIKTEFCHSSLMPALNCEQPSPVQRQSIRGTQDFKTLSEILRAGAISDKGKECIYAKG